MPNRPPSVRLRALALVGLALVIGCKKKTQPEPQGTSPPPVASALAAAVPRKPVVSSPDLPGPAYVVTRGGAFVYDAGKLARVEGIGPLTTGFTTGHHEIFAELAKDGTIWIASKQGVFRIAGDRSEQVDHGSASGLAVAPDGTAWTLDYAGAIRWGTTKEVVAKPAGVTSLTAIGVSADGRVHAASYKKAFVLDRGHWTKVSLSKASPPPYVTAFSRAPDGTFWAFTTDGPAKQTAAGAWTPVRLPRTADHLAPPVREGRFAADGSMAAHRERDLFVVDARGQASVTQLPSRRPITAAATDAMGRRWVGTSWGMTILSPDGETLQEWDSGALAGSPVAVIVIGKGPELAATPPPGVAADVAGTMVLDGQPLANTPIQLCESPDHLIGKTTPCEGQRSYEATTGPDGAFVIPALSSGAYAVAIRRGGWKAVSASDFRCCSQLTNGERAEIGEVLLRSSY